MKTGKRAEKLRRSEYTRKEIHTYKIDGSTKRLGKRFVPKIITSEQKLLKKNTLKLRNIMPLDRRQSTEGISDSKG